MPSRAPTNLTVFNFQSSTSLLLLWQPIPQEYLNGVLTGYTVRYQQIKEGDITTKSPIFSMEVSPDVSEVEIPNLASYSKYKLSMFAKTKVGGGRISNYVIGGIVLSVQISSLNGVSLLSLKRL